MIDFRIEPAGDAALRVELPARVDEAISARITAMGETVRSRWFDIVKDAVVGYHTLTVYFDPLRVDGRWLEEQLAVIAAETAVPPEVSQGHVEIPVCYGGDLGPDLADVAEAADCSQDEVVHLHTSRDYRVFVVGFVPGFGYLGPVDPRLALPRRRTPRTRVPAGSVALAGGQTGIYPMETPGGWHLIGRTSVRPFDEARAQPVLFRPGDTVRFRSVSRADYDQMSGV